MKILGFTLILFPIECFLRGLVFMYAWIWFVSSTLHIPALDIFQATGLSFFICHFLKTVNFPENEITFDYIIESLSKTVSWNITLFCLGWLLQFIIGIMSK